MSDDAAIHLPPQLHDRLAREAEARGLPADELLSHLVDAALAFDEMDLYQRPGSGEHLTAVLTRSPIVAISYPSEQDEETGEADEAADPGRFESVQRDTLDDQAHEQALVHRAHTMANADDVATIGVDVGELAQAPAVGLANGQDGSDQLESRRGRIGVRRRDRGRWEERVPESAPAHSLAFRRSSGCRSRGCEARWDQQHVGYTPQAERSIACLSRADRHRV